MHVEARAAAAGWPPGPARAVSHHPQSGMIQSRFTEVKAFKSGRRPTVTHRPCRRVTAAAAGGSPASLVTPLGRRRPQAVSESSGLPESATMPGAGPRRAASSTELSRRSISAAEARLRTDCRPDSAVMILNSVLASAAVMAAGSGTVTPIAIPLFARERAGGGDGS